MADHPVEVPFITDVLVEALHAAEDPYERAFETPFTHSQALKCSRFLGYSAMRYPESDPMDLAGHWVTSLGTWGHRELQKALLDRFPDASVEVRVRHGEISSGWVDALIYDIEYGTVVYELKHKGAYGWDKAVGINRKGYTRKAPEGPGWPAKVQGALNATALHADRLVIGVVALEAVSKQLAEKLGLSEVGRVIAEWHYTKAEFTPWANKELDRLAALKNVVGNGRLPDREGVDDDGRSIDLDPEASRPHWSCTYCSQRSRCIQDGPGVILPAKESHG
jgi:hypothetical protein